MFIELVREAWKLLSQPTTNLDRFFNTRSNYMANKNNVNKLSFLAASRAIRPQLVSLIAKIRHEEKKFLTERMKITKSICLQAASKKYEHQLAAVDHLLKQADHVRGKH